MATLQTRTIFIDTSIFVGANFSFGAEVFKSLATLTATSSVQVKLTDITIQEVKSNMRASIHEAAQALGPFRKRARILRNMGESPAYGWLFTDFPSEAIYAEIESGFLAYVAEIGAEILPATAANAAPIFEKYFRGEPPFGEGKKKAEFPDAFVLEALRDWCQRTGSPLYVISTDGDLRDGCSATGPLLHLNSLEEFVSLVLETDEALVEVVEERVRANVLAIARAVEEQFLENGAWLEDQDGDVTDVEVAQVDVDANSMSVIRVSDQEAVVELPVSIDYCAYYEYPDPDSCFYDSEEKQTHYFNTIKGSVDGVRECSAELTIGFSEADEATFAVKRVVVDGNDALSVIADEDAWNHYK